MDFEKSINNIINNLNDLKTSIEHKGLSYSDAFRLALISRFQMSGLKYEKIDYENCKYKKFFAFKIFKWTEDNFLYELDEVHKRLLEFINEQAKDAIEVSFGFLNIEELHDEYSFATLVRGMIYFKTRG